MPPPCPPPLFVTPPPTLHHPLSPLPPASQAQTTTLSCRGHLLGPVFQKHNTINILLRLLRHHLRVHCTVYTIITTIASTPSTSLTCTLYCVHNYNDCSFDSFDIGYSSIHTTRKRSSFLTIDKSGKCPRGSGILRHISSSHITPRAASLGVKPPNPASADCLLHDILFQFKIATENREPSREMAIPGE